MDTRVREYDEVDNISGPQDTKSHNAHCAVRLSSGETGWFVAFQLRVTNFN